MGVESQFRFDWTDDPVALAVKMWMAGDTAAKIATALGGGLTRSAVLGKINRMHLSRCALDAEPQVLAEVVDERVRLERDQRGNGRHRTPALNPRSPPAAASRPPRTPPAPIPVMLSQVKIADLLDCHCRWIPGAVVGADTFYCGEAVMPGGSYCEFHAEMNSGRGTVADRAGLRAIGKQWVSHGGSA